MPAILYVFLRWNVLDGPAAATLAAPFYTLDDQLCGAFPVFLNKPPVRKALQQQGLGFYVGSTTMHADPDKVLFC